MNVDIPRLAALAFALLHLHDVCSVIHSDVKTANLLLSHGGVLQLADLGAAARLGPDGLGSGCCVGSTASRVRVGDTDGVSTCITCGPSLTFHRSAATKPGWSSSTPPKAAAEPRSGARGGARRRRCCS